MAHSIKHQAGKTLHEDRFVPTDKDTGFVEYARILGMFVDLKKRTHGYWPCEFRPIEPWPELTEEQRNPSMLGVTVTPEGYIRYDCMYWSPYFGLGYLIITSYGLRYEMVNGERHPQEGMEYNV